MAIKLKRLWEKKYLKTSVTIVLIPLLVAGFWFGFQAGLNTRIFPLLTVISESMCIPEPTCDGWSHPFERTLHIGDLIIIQGVNPSDLKTDYPDSDIIVFQNPIIPADDSHANIVHRIVSIEEAEGTLYFHTKGDGNGYPNVWLNPVTRGIDPWISNPSDPTSTYEGAISEKYVYGKVIMRIPWIGTLSILAQQYTVIPIVLVLIIVILVIVEFVLPLLKDRTQAQPRID